MGGTIDCFLSSEACLISSGALKLVFREEAFRSVPAQEPLGPASKIHGVFSSRNLPCTSEGQLRAIAI